MTIDFVLFLILINESWQFNLIWIANMYLLFESFGFLKKDITSINIQSMQTFILVAWDNT